MPRETERTRRVAGLIRRELADLVSREMQDPRVRLVTITRVQVSRDLRNATVYISSLGGDATPVAQAVKALNHAGGFLRFHLGRRMDTKVTPQLRFEADDSIAKAITLSNLIDEARARDSAGHKDGNG